MLTDAPLPPQLAHARVRPRATESDAQRKVSASSPLTLVRRAFAIPYTMPTHLPPPPPPKNTPLPPACLPTPASARNRRSPGYQSKTRNRTRLRGRGRGRLRPPGPSPWQPPPPGPSSPPPAAPARWPPGTWCRFPETRSTTSLRPASAGACWGGREGWGGVARGGMEWGGVDTRRPRPRGFVMRLVLRQLVPAGVDRWPSFVVGVSFFCVACCCCRAGGSTPPSETKKGGSLFRRGVTWGERSGSG